LNHVPKHTHISTQSAFISSFLNEYLSLCNFNINPNITLTTPSYNLSNNAEALKTDILYHLYFTQGRTTTLATSHDWYMAVAYTLRSRLMKNWIDALTHFKDHQKKIVGYLSAEFLMGPHLGNAIINLDIYNEVSDALASLDLDINVILQQEVEPGLGNGGLVGWQHVI
jgi:starch phosphorylase